MSSMTPAKAGRIGLRSSLIGSLLFAIIEGIKLKTDGDITSAEFLESNLPWILVIFCIGSLLSAAPGYVGGKKIENLCRTSKHNNLSLMAIGAGLGVIAVVVISLPYLCVVLAAHNYWSLINNPAFPIYITRLIEGIIIAGLMGSWSGFLIAKS